MPRPQRQNPYVHHYYLEVDENNIPQERVAATPGAARRAARIPTQAFSHVSGGRAIVSSRHPVNRPGWQRMEPHFYWAPVYIDEDGSIQAGQDDGQGGVVAWADVGLTAYFLERAEPGENEVKGAPLRFFVRSLEPLDVPGWSPASAAELDAHPQCSPGKAAVVKAVFVPDFEEMHNNQMRRLRGNVASIVLGGE